MHDQPQAGRQKPWPFASPGGVGCLALVAFLLFSTSLGRAQVEDEESSSAKVPVSQTAKAAVPPQVMAALQSVTTRDVGALSAALHIGEGPKGPVPGVPPNSLASVGDLDGDGVPEMVLRWAIPDAEAGAEVAPAADSQPLWGIYLLSWDGAHWKASTLVSEVEDAMILPLNLGTPSARGLVVVTSEGEDRIAYPLVFQVKEHEAALVWDAQAEDSRYEALLRGQISFPNPQDAAPEMVVTGHADPGILEFDRQGRRGFSARAVYRWDGKAFVPVKVIYSANQDYTLYGFIAALHLHDFRSAYALIAPAQLLESDSPTLEAFRKYAEDNWPEFLDDQVFEAPELPSGAPDDHLFVLSESEKQYVYHPTFSSDGKFLLTGLKRAEAALPPDPAPR